jgi:tetratricopeptide (TPR) repeat protein
VTGVVAAGVGARYHGALGTPSNRVRPAFFSDGNDDMTHRCSPVLCIATLLASALLLGGCGGEEDQPGSAASRPPEAEARLADEARNWRSKYEELVNDQETLHVKFVGLQAENEDLEKKLGELTAERETLHDRIIQLQQPTPPPTQPATPDQADDSRERLDAAVARLEDLGAALFEQDQYSIARTVLRIAQQAGAESAVTHYRLGRCEAAVTNYEAARTEYELALAALEHQPEPHEELLKKTLSNHGAVLERLGEPEEAEKAYQKAIALDAEYTPALFNLGRLYAEELERPSEAIELLRRHVIHGGRRGISARNLIEKLQAAQDAAKPEG